MRTRLCTSLFWLFGSCFAVIPAVASGQAIGLGRASSGQQAQTSREVDVQELQRLALAGNIELQAVRQEIAVP